MNANSKPKVPTLPTIHSWLVNAERQLEEADISSSRLDAELLLCHTLKKERTWLIAHGNETLERKLLHESEASLERRLAREPIAYIVGYKEFYGRTFIVTSDTLIPRSETEDLIELIAKQLHSSSVRLLDVGCGSGCIGITLKLEVPALNVTLSDISNSALKVAQKNAHRLGAKQVRYVTSNLLDHWLSHEKSKVFDIIVANLPYVDRSWKTSPELKHEPDVALYARDNGLALIKKLITQSKSLLVNNGYLALEADPEQHEAIIRYAEPNLRHIETQGYALILQKH